MEKERETEEKKKEKEKDNEKKQTNLEGRRWSRGPRRGRSRGPPAASRSTASTSASTSDRVNIYNTSVFLFPANSPPGNSYAPAPASCCLSCPCLSLGVPGRVIGRAPAGLRAYSNFLLLSSSRPQLATFTTASSFRDFVLEICIGPKPFLRGGGRPGPPPPPPPCSDRRCFWKSLMELILIIYL